LNKQDVIAYLNEEIANLTRTRDWLSGSANGTSASVQETGSESDTPATRGPGRPRKGISAAGRRKISAMMKARWAARRQQAGPGSSGGKATVAVLSGKRNISTASRAKMAAAQKRRWAAFKKKKAGK
jgi:hypothetical protein